MSDRVAIACPHCGSRFAMPSQYLGKRATCKSCSQKFVATVAAPQRQSPSGAAKATAPAQSPPPRPAEPRSSPVDRAAPPITAPAVALAAGNSLDDSVIAWLNAADVDEVVPGKPKVVTTADLCSPSQRDEVKSRAILRGPHHAEAKPQPTTH